jgi:hypothetical protein
MREPGVIPGIVNLSLRSLDIIISIFIVAKSSQEFTKWQLLRVY